MTVRIAFFAPLLGTGGTQRHLQQVLALLDPARFRAHVYTLRPGGEVEDELRASGVRGHVARDRVAPDRAALGAGDRADGSCAAPGAGRHRPRVSVAAGAGRRRSSGGSRACRCVWRASGVSRATTARATRLAAHRAPGRHRDRERRRAAERGRDARACAAAGRSCRTASTPTHFRVARRARSARGGLGLDPERPVIGTVGRLEDRKGHEQLLLAAPDA